MSKLHSERNFIFKIGPVQIDLNSNLDLGKSNPDHSAIWHNTVTTLVLVCPEYTIWFPIESSPPTIWLGVSERKILLPYVHNMINNLTKKQNFFGVNPTTFLWQCFNPLWCATRKHSDQEIEKREIIGGENTKSWAVPDSHCMLTKKATKVYLKRVHEYKCISHRASSSMREEETTRGGGRILLLSYMPAAARPWWIGGGCGSNHEQHRSLFLARRWKRPRRKQQKLLHPL